jgi:hypothetical protein
MQHLLCGVIQHLAAAARHHGNVEHTAVGRHRESQRYGSLLTLSTRYFRIALVCFQPGGEEFVPACDR